jgi:hypothetical protein
LDLHLASSASTASHMESSAVGGSSRAPISKFLDSGTVCVATPAAIPIEGFVHLKRASSVIWIEVGTSSKRLLPFTSLNKIQSTGGTPAAAWAVDPSSHQWELDDVELRSAVAETLLALAKFSAFNLLSGWLPAV